jgi:NAD(P)-dependent dehydrogenase (short-subunit alcohol dehydrogenase family)
MPDRLKDKVAIITGIGGSIGQAAALAFAREGARVVGSGQNAGDTIETVQAVRAAGGTIAALEPCDLGNPEDVQALVDFALNAHPNFR